jgi:hypothetical protein
MEIPMKLLIATAALGGLLVVGPVSDASAWTREGTVTTGRGTYTVNGGGSCGGGVCRWGRTITGPNGGTVHRGGVVARTGPGRYRYWNRTVGPNGGTVVHTGRVYVGY